MQCVRGVVGKSSPLKANCDDQGLGAHLSFGGVFWVLFVGVVVL